MSAIGLLTGQLADVRAQLKAAQDGWGRTANDLASETQRANRAERLAENMKATLFMERELRSRAEAVATERCEECDHPDSVHNQLHKRAARHDEEPDFAIRAVRIFRKALHELYGEERP